jgi:hypothetical protein
MIPVSHLQQDTAKLLKQLRNSKEPFVYEDNKDVPYLKALMNNDSRQAD